MSTQTTTDQAKTVQCYKINLEHIEDELKKLDLLIKLRVAGFRQSLKEIEGIAPLRYISHEEVDILLNQSSFFENDDHTESENILKQLDILQNEINTKLTESVKQGCFLSMVQLSRIFSLSPFEIQTIVICLAPELDKKYDKLYAYLQDDITRKKPSVDLVLDLLCGTKADKWKARTLFSENSPLFYTGILQRINDPESPSGSSGLAQFLKLDQRIINYILGNNSIDGQLHGLVRLYNTLPSISHVLIDSSIKEKLFHLVKSHFTEKRPDGKNLVFYFHGPYGVGKRDLALEVCRELNCYMLYMDMELIINDNQDFETRLKILFREGLLLQAAIYIDNIDILQDEEKKTKALMKKLILLIKEYGWLTFLAGGKSWLAKGIFENMVFYKLELPVPDVLLREAEWKRRLEDLEADTSMAIQLANQFSLTLGQIRDAAELVKNNCRIIINKQNGITLSEVYSACRSQSNQKLSELSLKIEPCYSWEDIVLPEDKLLHLKEICGHVRNRYRVFGEWGFDRKLSHGKGLSVLFIGPSGTGKTMAAEVIAHELQLDLYKIDLSAVISKYVGETEKNLNRIFQEAETSNAILFFDEADALFGKRTEVSDAHDRYANIETSYLLQKMEEYEGIVILATNLRGNMDDAFIRRIRFIVEFPFPDKASRLKIWKTHFPREAPVSNEIDYKFLSEKFPIAGGNIKNIVLSAAFLAAQDGGMIEMEHIIHGAKREFEKIGKLWDEKNLYKSTSIDVQRRK